MTCFEKNLRFLIISVLVLFCRSVCRKQEVLQYELERAEENLAARSLQRDQIMVSQIYAFLNETYDSDIDDGNNVDEMWLSGQKQTVKLVLHNIRPGSHVHIFSK